MDILSGYNKKMLTLKHNTNKPERRRQMNNFAEVVGKINELSGTDRLAYDRMAGRRCSRRPPQKNC